MRPTKAAWESARGGSSSGAAVSAPGRGLLLSQRPWTPGTTASASGQQLQSDAAYGAQDAGPAARDEAPTKGSSPLLQEYTSPAALSSGQQQQQPSLLAAELQVQMELSAQQLLAAQLVYAAAASDPQRSGAAEALAAALFDPLFTWDAAAFDACAPLLGSLLPLRKAEPASTTVSCDGSETSHWTNYASGSGHALPYALADAAACTSPGQAPWSPQPNASASAAWHDACNNAAAVMASPSPTSAAQWQRHDTQGCGRRQSSELPPAVAVAATGKEAAAARRLCGERSVPAAPAAVLKLEMMDEAAGESGHDGGVSRVPALSGNDLPAWGLEGAAGALFPAGMAGHEPALPACGARLPLQMASGQGTVYVNARQYRTILRRRQQRAKRNGGELCGGRQRKPFMHLSRHMHAVRRVRGSCGRFAPAELAPAPKPADDVPSSPFTSRNASSSSPLAGDREPPRQQQQQQQQDGDPAVLSGVEYVDEDLLELLNFEGDDEDMRMYTA